MKAVSNTMSYAKTNPQIVLRPHGAVEPNPALRVLFYDATFEYLKGLGLQLI